METKILSADDPDSTNAAVDEAVAILNDGGVVALPTETVYGLAADAFNPDAVAQVFSIKERPSFDPLIVHVQGAEYLDEVAKDIPESVYELTDAFWPGALTFILPKTDNVPDIVTAGLDTVAVRVSANPVMKAVVKKLGRPIAAPSANRFGRISPTSAAAVEEELGGKIPLIINGGACHWGVESTIVKVEDPVPSHDKPKIRITLLRAGPVTVEDLKKLGRVRIENDPAAPGETPDAPGRVESHYAPATPLRLLSSPKDFEPEEGKRYALMSFRGLDKDGYVPLHNWEHVEILSPGSGKLPEAAVRLFHVMRKLDALGVDEIIAEPVRDHLLGRAILERLKRAAMK